MTTAAISEKNVRNAIAAINEFKTTAPTQPEIDFMNDLTLLMDKNADSVINMNATDLSALFALLDDVPSQHVPNWD